MSARQLPQKKTLNRIIDLNIRRSIGAISSIEYKRYRLLNEINQIGYAFNKSSNYPHFIDPMNFEVIGHEHANITSIETDPREYRCLLAAYTSSNIAIYNVDRDVEIFEKMVHMPVPRTDCDHYGIPNSVHWLWDGTIFTAATKAAVHFWDSSTCTVVDVVELLQDQVLNHVIAASKYSTNKDVAVTGIEGHVFMIDMRYGVVVMTMPNVEKAPIRAIKWSPTNERQYITGNDNGNICLWDIRFRRNFICKFNNDDSFVKTASHSHPVIGLSFYNNGNSILSVDYKGTIKTWGVNTGRRHPNYYEPVALCDSNKNYLKSYQFAITENLKQDIVFLPSKKGLRIFDIDTGEHLPNSNDIPLPLNCANYNSKNVCVYSASSNIIKAWTTDQKNVTPT